MSVRRVDGGSLFRHLFPATGPAGTAHGPAVDLKPSAVARTGTNGSGEAPHPFSVLTPRSEDPFENTDKPYGALQPETTDAERFAHEEKRYKFFTSGPALGPEPDGGMQTGILGRFWLHGPFQDNPSAAQLKAAFARTMETSAVPNAGRGVLVMLKEVNGVMLDSSTPLTVVEYELLGLTTDEGNLFLKLFRESAGTTQEGVNALMKKLFGLNSMPKGKPRDLPVWGQKPTGWGRGKRITGNFGGLLKRDYEAWGNVAAAEREAERV